MYIGRIPLENIANNAAINEYLLILFKTVQGLSNPSHSVISSRHLSVTLGISMLFLVSFYCAGGA